jgi:hypothetical protein
MRAANDVESRATDCAEGPLIDEGTGRVEDMFKRRGADRVSTCTAHR